MMDLHYSAHQTSIYSLFPLPSTLDPRRKNDSFWQKSVVLFSFGKPKNGRFIYISNQIFRPPMSMFSVENKIEKYLVKKKWNLQFFLIIQIKFIFQTVFFFLLKLDVQRNQNKQIIAIAWKEIWITKKNGGLKLVHNLWIEMTYWDWFF